MRCRRVRFKPSEALRFLGGLAAAAIVLGLVVLRVTSCAPAPPPRPRPVPIAPPAAPPPPVAPPVETTGACGQGPAEAARANTAALETLTWRPFGRAEAGWETYAPLIARELRTSCAPQTPGFAAALAAWAGAQRLPADGVMTEAAFARLKGLIQMRRPFVRLSAQGVCPAAPAAGQLASAAVAEGYAGKAIQLRPGALAAYRRMAAAARTEDPRIAADPRNLTIFSGFRSPESDAARCAKEGNCNGVVRATCSPHRTGLAMDLYVGQAPGFGPDSSADANRLFMSRTPAYRWLVANADRFGFVPYPFEPWHWEWTGEAP
ncbi:M15 family metallopeptidase [Phenylobacterium sp.]|uniref:M15 family metallopeptidase n=1 Tax=Phenylobacterium sp. TaxID=1871053 RepID=UPI003562F178